MAGERWNVAAYEAFADERLKPAIDLLARIPDIDGVVGDCVDLGCGAGAAAPLLRARFSGARLIGVDASADMLEKARGSGQYDALVDADIAQWSPAVPPSVIFCNAALHWLGDHDRLAPRLYEALSPGGALAVQMPGQLERPSHTTMIEAARAVRPDLFTGWTPFPGPLPLERYARMLGEATTDCWSVDYEQQLGPTRDGAHPVRAFVSSTGARPILSRLDEDETLRFAAIWDELLNVAYPRDASGGCAFPFRRVFFIAKRMG